MITQKANDRIIADRQVVEFTKNHNIHLMAFGPLLNFMKEALQHDNYDDLRGSMNSALYDIECLDDLLHENYERLQEAKKHYAS